MAKTAGGRLMEATAMTDDSGKSIHIPTPRCAEPGGEPSFGLGVGQCRFKARPRFLARRFNPACFCAVRAPSRSLA